MNYKLQPGLERKKIEFVKSEYKEPIISIITPFYNSYKYIEQTANSVLNQTYPNFEWIIVNDGSTNEKSLEKLKEIEKLDNRIKVYHKSNEGLSATRDFGASKTSQTSKYYLFLDDDDVIVNNYLEIALWTLETNKEASWTYTNTVNFMGEEYVWSRFLNHKRMFKENALVSLALIKREAYNLVGGYGLREKSINEDWIFWLKLMRNGRYPVKMSFNGFWYRRKPAIESELAKSRKKTNLKKTLKYIKEEQEQTKSFINPKYYPINTYNWDVIREENDDILKYQHKKNSKIKILVMLPWMVVGGADKFNLDMIRGCNKEKYEFIIISTLPSGNVWKNKFEEFATIYDLPSFLDKKDWLSFINYIIYTNNINIFLNTNSTFGYSVIPYIKTKYPDLTVIDYIHMEEWYDRNGGFVRDNSGVNSFIDKTLVCNGNTKKVMMDYFNIDKNKIDVVYIGSDEKEFDPKKYKKQEALDYFNLQEDNKIKIGYICRITEQKRPFLLLDIVKKIKTIRKDFTVIIAGDGNLLSSMRKKAKKMGLLDTLIFLGNVNDTKLVYTLCDLTINCSIKEGLALTSYESLLMGKPVISSDVGGQAELIDNSVGIVVKCMQKEYEVRNYNYSNEEIDLYVNALNEVMNNLDKYSKKCRNKILNGFTINNMIEKMESIFTSMSGTNEVNINSKHIDITKELITKYFISTKDEYNYLVGEYVRNNYIEVDRPLIWKIKRPFYLILNKIGIYDKIKGYRRK